MVPNREIKADNTLVFGDDNYREGDIVSISQQKINTWRYKNNCQDTSINYNCRLYKINSYFFHIAAVKFRKKCCNV